MKKLIALTIVLILLMTLFVGCKPKVSVSEAVNRLRSNGFVSSASYVDPKELEVFTSFTNDEIKRMGGSFKIKIVERHYFASSIDSSQSCTLIVFATANQARKYANCKAIDFAKRREESGYLNSGDFGGYWGNPLPNETFKWKVAHSGRLVIISNCDIAMDAIDLNFR